MKEEMSVVMIVMELVVGCWRITCVEVEGGGYGVTGDGDSDGVW